MTASRLTTVFCDEAGCGQWRDEGVADTAAEARANLAPLGWQVDVPTDDRRTRLDYCPLHRKDR